MSRETTLTPADAVAQAIRQPRHAGSPALVAFLTGGFPDLDTFVEHAVAVSQVADVLEIGVPFRDPMADGVTIQRASHTALDRGASLARILERLRSRRGELGCPLLLMSYLNPLLARGLERLHDEAQDCGIHGYIVPDLCLEESEQQVARCREVGLAFVQLAAPATPDARLARLCEASSGFVYAVTRNGTTGGTEAPVDPLPHLRRVKQHAGALPVCAGFGISSADDIAELHGVVDGAIVGSALIRAIEAGQDPAAFVRALRPATPAQETSR